MNPNSRFVAANGLNLHLLDFGNEACPGVVCIHGLTGNAHHFDALAPHLSGRYHVISLDVRGRGDSQWGSPFDYTLPVYVKDLAAILDRLGLARVSLIGTSMGGLISMLFAGEKPERVERIVLNDIGPEIDPHGLARIAAYVGNAPAKFAGLEAVVKYYLETYPPCRQWPRHLLAQWAATAVKPTGDGNLTWKMDPAIRRPVAGAIPAQPVDLWGSYGRIRASLLVVRGAETDILSDSALKRMRREQPGLEVAEVPGVGHAPTLVEPQALSAIKRFFGC